MCDCDLSERCECFLIIIFGLGLTGRWGSSLVIGLILLSKNYDNEILLLTIFAIICNLVLICAFVFVCFSAKYKKKSNDGYLYQSVFEEEEEKEKKYKFCVKLEIIFIIISYIFSIGIIVEYIRFSKGYRSLDENTTDVLTTHIISFIADILSAGILACNYCSKK